MEASEKENQINRACERLGANQHLYNQRTVEQMRKLVNLFQENDLILNNISSTKQSLAVKAGFAAEVVHTETFNANAINRGKTIRAFNDNIENSQNKRWYELGFHKNDNPDVILVNNDEVISKAQLKYYKNGKSTANALRKTQNGQIKYKDNDQFLVAKDKLQTTKTAAKKLQLKELGKDNPRKSVVEATQQVQDKTTAFLQADGVESRPLTSNEARNIGKNGEKSDVRKTYISSFEKESTITQMKQSGVQAAAITAIISGISNTIGYLKAVSNGEIEPQEAFFKIAHNTALCSLDSAVKASLSTGLISLLTKESIIPEKGNPFISGAVFTGIGLACDFAKDLVLLSTGKISDMELQDRTSKNLIFAPVTYIGSVVGTSIAQMLEFDGIGALMGGVIGSALFNIALQFAIENGIEKPYRELLTNQEQYLNGINTFNNTLSDIDNCIQPIDVNLLISQALVVNTYQKEDRINKKQRIISQLLRRI